MRGERMRCNTLMMSPPGSSPHARGTLGEVDAQLAHGRFIPACAGNAKILPTLHYVISVHPRMRGERPVRCLLSSVRDGSSPHARGTLSDARPILSAIRFIPACAGNAFRPMIPGRMRAVHPRMRGERGLTPWTRRNTCGSSPHARGTLGFGQPHARRQRFIPACAGNARQQLGAGSLCSVHPRMRGERQLHDFQILRDVGSSPHARGTRTLRHGLNGDVRFIPACAGNAEFAARHSDKRAVHPRMRGERWNDLATVQLIVGSSPHARGTRKYIPKR